MTHINQRAWRHMLGCTSFEVCLFFGSPFSAIGLGVYNEQWKEALLVLRRLHVVILFMLIHCGYEELGKRCDQNLQHQRRRKCTCYSKARHGCSVGLAFMFYMPCIQALLGNNILSQLEGLFLCLNIYILSKSKNKNLSPRIIRKKWI